MAVEGVFAVALMALIFVVVFVTRSVFFTNQEADIPREASVAALTHDGVANHHLVVYLCVDPASDSVDGTAVIERFNGYLNLKLPGTVNPTTSLGFLAASYSGTTFPISPGCLADPKVRDLAGQTYGAAGLFAGKSDVVNYIQHGPPPQDVTRAVVAGFPVILAPAASYDVVPVSFRWPGVQRRGWSDRFVRLDFSKMVEISGTYETPSDVWIYLPANTTPIDPPSAAVLSTGRNGIHVFDFPVRGDNPTVEIDWIDQSLALSRDFGLLGVGALLGVLGGILGGMFFAPPRWRDPFLRLLEQRRANRHV